MVTKIVTKKRRPKKWVILTHFWQKPRLSTTLAKKPGFLETNDQSKNPKKAP